MLVSSSKNPVRDQMLEAQIEHHKLGISRRTLTRRLKVNIKRARRFKQAYVKKEISGLNYKKREDYSREHKNKIIYDFWQYIYFTDEAYINPSSQAQGYILREEGTRTDTENIQERGEKG